MILRSALILSPRRWLELAFGKSDFSWYLGLVGYLMYLKVQVAALCYCWARTKLEKAL